MNYFFIKLLSIGLFLIASINAFGYDYETDGLYYNINAANGTASITTGESAYVGDINIPDNIDVKGKLLKVTSIGTAFAGSAISSLSIGVNVSEIEYNALRNCQKLSKLIFRESENPLTLKCYVVNMYVTYGLFYDLPLTEVYFGRPIICDRNWSPFLGSGSKCTTLETIHFTGGCDVIPANVCESSTIKNIYIGSKVTSINSNAFYRCDNLQNIYIDDVNSFASINFNSYPQEGHNLFLNGEPANELSISSETISSSAFKGIQNIESINLEDSVLSIGSNAFSNCPQLKSIAIKGESISWSNYAFAYNNSLEYFEAPNLKDLGEAALYSCSNISSISLPKLLKISNSAFSGCRNLTDVNFPIVESIGSMAFYNTNIENLILPSIITIQNQAFEYCYNLKEVTLGIKTKSLGSSLFNGCKNIENLNIKALNPPFADGAISDFLYVNTTLNVPSISFQEYKETSPWSLFFDMDEMNLDYIEIDDCIYYADGTVGFFIKVNDKDKNTIVILNSFLYENENIIVSEYLDNCFQGSDNIKNLTFSNNFSSLPNISNLILLEEIDLNEISTDLPDSYFKNLSYLNSVLNFHNILSIGDNSFNGCSSLTTLDLGNKITSIGESAFYNCSSLSSLTIPSSCLNVGNNCFHGCLNLKDLEFLYSDKPITLGYNTNLTVNPTIYTNNSGNSGSAVDDYHTGYRNAYYDGLFFGLPIEHIKINRDIQLSQYYERIPGTPTSFYYIMYNDVIFNPPFYGLDNLKQIEIGSNVNSITKNSISAYVNAKQSEVDYLNFGNCNNIKVVVSLNPSAPIGGGFSKNTYRDAYLFLPNGNITSYEEDQYWKNFINIYQAEFVPIETIKIESQELEIGYNESIELLVKITPDNASIKELTWTSSNPNILSVDEKGIITSYDKSGEVTISASTKDGSNLDTSCVVKIEKIIIQPESLLLNYTDLELNVNQTFQLIAEVLPENTDDKTITWTSSNKNVVSVSNDGIVKGLALGDAIITATCGNVSAQCKVSVVPIEPEELILNETSLSLSKGTEFQLKASVKPDNVTDNTIIWSSGNDKIASVSNSGVVKGIEIGTTTITATCGNISATCEITVTDENGVESVLNDDDTLFNVYSLSGILIKENLTYKEINKLAPGIYIIRSRKGTFKINI